MKNLKLILISVCLMVAVSMQAQNKTVELRVVETSDVHGLFFPYDFMTRRDVKGSLARVNTFVANARRESGDNLLLFDNGDILQGQPTAYYYNYMDTESTHAAAAMLNYMGYNAANLGNHDIETGNAVFERWASDCNFPVLGANVVDAVTGEPRFKPYEVYERDGVRVAVLGMITPAIPVWLSENLWKGLRFEDMEQTARKYMPLLKDKEHADVVIGLFHTGSEAQWLDGVYREHAAAEVAQRVPGFDVVLCGHDHRKTNEFVVNTQGDSVLIINPANGARVVADVRITCRVSHGKVVDKTVSGKLASMDSVTVSQSFMTKFAPEYAAINQFVNRKIGHFNRTVSTRDAYFGSSAFIDLIHTLQLAITKADISITAPLSFDAEIKEGDVFVSDMFNLYKYENMLYTMELTGREVLGMLEFSYGLWLNQMTTPADHLLLFKKEQAGTDNRGRFENPMYNFDSAAGICYTVDVTKPAGSRLTILSMADGKPFELDKRYRVAINSYRGNGGGEHLTRGAGIAQEELPKRIVDSTVKDLRYYLMEYIERNPEINPQPLNQWHIIPEDWAKEAARRDAELLYGN